MKSYPIKADLDLYVDPYAAIPTEIIKQNPWHWDPMEVNHKDGGSWLYQDKSICWFDLAEWAIAKSNEIRVPQKYWWWDDEKNQAMHADESVNHCPIFETCKQWMVQNDYNEHNTRYFKFANEELEEFYEPLKRMFDDKLDDMTMSLFVQPPGQVMPDHVYTFSSYMRKTGEYPDYSRLRRYMTFVSDWDWGHFFHYGNHVMQPWRQGDTWDLVPGIYHGSANSGVTPKITMHWSGKLK